MAHTDLLPPALLAATLLIGGCSGGDDSDRPSRPDSSSATAVTDAWLGQWNGPEGTFLRLEGGEGKYTVIIQNLDGPQTYQGSANGSQVQFDRNGVREAIRATTGADTGMKWLSDKAHCLTIRTGEGYCRE